MTRSRNMLRALLVCMFVGNSRGRPTALDPGEPFVDASVALTCPTCGRLGDGDPNCCSPGGSWHGMCEGGAGGGQYTFHDGYQACSGEKLAASVLPGMPFSCPGTKPDKRVDCGDYGSEQGCLAYGCCFNALPPGEVGPSCYLPTVPKPSYEEAHEVMYYLYFVLASASPTHSNADYIGRLRAGCARLTKAGKTFAILGDVEWVLSVAPPCKLASQKASKQFSLDSLPNPQSMSKYTESIGGDCGNKLPLFHWVPMPPGRFKTLATIWHSKLGVLCDAARQRPNELSVLLDGGLMTTPNAISSAEIALNLTKAVIFPPMKRLEERVLIKRDQMAMGWVDSAQRENERENGKLQVECYLTDCSSIRRPPEKPNFYEKPACNANDARLAAGVLALRGADCDAIERAYMNAIADIASGPCNCYDEEIILTRMFDEARSKSLIKPHYGDEDGS